MHSIYSIDSRLKDIKPELKIIVCALANIRTKINKGRVDGRGLNVWSSRNLSGSLRNASVFSGFGPLAAGTKDLVWLNAGTEQKLVAFNTHYILNVVSPVQGQVAPVTPVKVSSLH